MGLAASQGDYDNEFVTGSRKNERFHIMWETTTAESQIVRQYTGDENEILELDELQEDLASPVAGAEETTPPPPPPTAIDEVRPTPSASC